jgi:hypothetical protein
MGGLPGCIRRRQPAGVEDSHAIAVQKLVEARTALRDAEFNKIRQRLGDEWRTGSEWNGTQKLLREFLQPASAATIV